MELLTASNFEGFEPPIWHRQTELQMAARRAADDDEDLDLDEDLDDDEDDEDDEDLDDDEDDEDDDDEDDEPKGKRKSTDDGAGGPVTRKYVASLQKRLEETQASRKKTVAGRKADKATIAELQNKLTLAQAGKPTGTPAAKRRAAAPEVDDSEARVTVARNEATTSAQSAADERVIRQAARRGLIAAGLSGVSDASAVAMLKLSDVELDDDDEPIGLEEQIEKFKKKNPRLFEPEKPKPRRQSVNAGTERNGSRGTSKKLDATDRQVQQLLGKGRR